MERILSLLPSTTEIAGALGLAHRLVGRSHECDLPYGVTALPVVTEPKLDVDASSREIDRCVRELVRDGLSVYRVDAERVRHLQPQVILTQTQCEVCAVTPGDLREALGEWVGLAPELVAVEQHGPRMNHWLNLAYACSDQVQEPGIAMDQAITVARVLTGLEFENRDQTGWSGALSRALRYRIADGLRR